MWHTDGHPFPSLFLLFSPHPEPADDLWKNNSENGRAATRGSAAAGGGEEEDGREGGRADLDLATRREEWRVSTAKRGREMKLAVVYKFSLEDPLLDL